MKFVIIISLILTIFIFGTYLTYPLRPHSWDNLKIGMTERDVVLIIKGSYNQPSGLEAAGTWERSNKFTYSLGQHQNLAGREFYLELTYDGTGSASSIGRKLVDFKIIENRKNFIDWLKDLIK